MIELMVAVSIIGILLSLSIPTYLDYAIRSKISEAIQIASAAKVSIIEFYISQGSLPETLTEAGVANISTHYIASIDYEHSDGDDESNETGQLVITLSENVGAEVANRKLVVEAEVLDNGLIGWRCRADDTDGVPTHLLPASCRGDS